MMAVMQRFARSACAPLLAIMLLVSLAACETPHGSLGGGASSEGGGGRIKIGWPF